MALGLALLAPWHAFAIDASTREAQLLLRVLSYDRNLKTRVGDNVVIGVLHRPDDPVSTETAARITEGLRHVPSPVVTGLPMLIVDIPWAEGSLAADVARESVDVLYVCEGLDDQFPAIQAVSRARHLLTVGANAGFVALGMSVSVVPGASPPIAINVTASKAEGAYFGADLLTIASVVR